MESLSQDLLAYSRLATADLSLEPVDLEGAALEALTALETEVKNRGGVLRVEGPLFKVLANREALVRILGILFYAALKVVRPGDPPLVKVTAERHGDIVRVSIQDIGIEIRDAVPHRESGASAPPNGTEDQPGTGLGMALVLRGVERMGGHSGVESEPGQGRRFWIELRGA